MCTLNRPLVRGEPVRDRSAISHRLVVATLAAIAGVSVVTVAAAASTAETKPSISHYTASPDQFTYLGGRFLLGADTSNAGTCEFLSAWAIPGLPATQSCTGGRAAISLAVGHNTSSVVDNVPLTLKATASDGAWEAETLYVHVLPQRPAITSFTASPASLPSSGGKVTLTGRLARAAVCIISSDPSVAGLPASFPCKTGVTTTVTLPATTSGLAGEYDFVLTAANAGGATNAEATAVVAAQVPTVSDFTATPSTLPASGGTVTLSAKVTNAVGCNYGDDWSGGTQPKGTNPVSNLPKSISCTSGTIVFQATVIPDTGQKGETITFLMTVNSQSRVVDATEEPVVTEAGTPA
jgi:hypothetical protein